MENLNTLNGVQSGAVDPSTENPVNAGASEVVTPKADEGKTSVPKAAETAKSADPATAAKQTAKEADKPKQSKEENAAIAKMRRDNQELQRQLEEARRESQKVDSTISKHFGLSKGSLADKTEEITARALGMSVEDFRAREAIETQKAQESLKANPEYQKVLRQNEELVKKLMEKQGKEDLAAIKAAYPDETAESIEELGESFALMRSVRIGLMEAYNAIRATRKLAEPEPQPEPPAMGAVNEQSQPESEYYSAEEIDYYEKHPEKMKDPKIVEKLVKSFSHLKRK